MDPLLTWFPKDLRRRTRMDRETTTELLKEFVRTESLMKHLLGVEAAMRAYARMWRGG